MTAILPEELAKLHSYALIDRLDRSALGNKLKEKNSGRMIGILVSSDGSISYSYSGAYSDDFYDFNSSSGSPSGAFNTSSGFVMPCYNMNLYNQILDKYGCNLDAISADNSRKCFTELLGLYEFYAYDGSVKRLIDIYPNAPSGTGDCCAPRLLSNCYKNKLKPISMCEFFYGDGTLKHKEYYTPCDNKCKNLLKHIIGLDIIYYDSDIVAINKPSNLLSVPGVKDKDSVQLRVKNFYKDCIEQPAVHRLDRDTSGIIILALTELAHNRLSVQFQERIVKKTYVALVDGVLKEKSGVIDLPIAKDKNQTLKYLVDTDNGKQSLTRWELVRVEKKKEGNKEHLYSRISLMPTTGRTHQIRVHCTYGLNMPLINDNIYTNGNNFIKTINNGNLTLCANRISFIHPVSNKEITLTVKEEF